jgi:hypothetical protein
MATLIYTYPEDNVAPEASWSLTSGSAAAGYPLDNLTDLIPAKPFKAASGSGVTIEADFGSPEVEVELIAFVGQHNLAGATVKVDNNGGMAQQTLAIPAVRTDGHSVCPYLDLSAVSENAGTTWTFTITGASAPPAIGEIVMYATKRSLVRNPAYGFVDDEVHPIIEHPTDFGFVKAPYDLGVTWRTLSGLDVLDTVANIALIRDWHRACQGRVKGSLVVLDPDVNDARFVRFLEPRWAHVLSFPALHRTSFALEEVARGPVL